MSESAKIEFRTILGFPDYQVSDTGVVRSKRKSTAGGEWRTLKPGVGKDGRLSVAIFSSTGKERRCRIATLVLETFVGPRPEGMDACHFPDRDPSNNYVDNLRWDTRKANVADSFSHDTFPLGERHPAAKLKVDDVRRIRKLASMGRTAWKIAKLYSIDPTTVRNIVDRKKWKSVV